MRINHNLGAMNAQRNMNVNSGAASKSMEKLSSGLKINRAGDNAAGLSISEKMRGQIRGLNQASTNAEDSISMIQTAEGALNETHSIIQRMRELSVQSVNDTNTDDDRKAIQKEVDQLGQEIDRISNQTEFNTKKLLDGTLGATVDTDVTASSIFKGVGIASVQSEGLIANNTGEAYEIIKNDTKGTYDLRISGTTATVGTISQSDVTAGKSGSLNFKDESGKSLLTITTNSGFTGAGSLTAGSIKVTGTEVKFQIGANSNQTVGLSVGNMGKTGLGLNSVNVSTSDNAKDAITSLDSALSTVSDTRANLGAMQNRLEHTINNLGTASENLTAAESRIRDTDMATEMSEYSKNNILQQAAQAMLAQAKSAPQSVLQLLQG